MAFLVPLEDLFEYIKDHIPSNRHQIISEYLFEEPDDSYRSENANKWLFWCESQHNLKTISADIPQGILPPGYTGSLTDVRVQARGPDDKVYDRNALFRKRVARGNTVLELKKNDDPAQLDCVIYALKKFTGGLGDDDDREIEDGFKWQKYFTKPISEATNVICTKKMNGEAAHFAIRWIENDFYVIAGSKNVHLLFRTSDQIDRYTDTRYMVAKDVAHSCFRFFEQMDTHSRNILFSFFHYTKLTAVLEILQPKYQHVENLSHLLEPELYFISWSRSLEDGYEDEICIAPDLGQDIAKAFGLKVTGYSLIPHNHQSITKKLMEIRCGFGYEGEVLYFVDSGDNVIGLLKKKTVWYIIVRAVREKARRMKKRDSNEIALSDTLTKTSKRIKEIQRWLGLDEDATKEWDDLATKFLKWLAKGLKEKNVDIEDLYKVYPVVWSRFLKETSSSDKIELRDVTMKDDPDNPVEDGSDEKE